MQRFKSSITLKDAKAKFEIDGMPIVEIQTPDGDTMLVHKEQGFSYTEAMVKFAMPAKNLKLQYQWMKEMDVRDDDIMICAYVKAGTHWLWEVASMLSKGHANYEKQSKEATMLEFLTKEQVAALPSPRVLNTHHTTPLLPEGFLDRKCKIINVMRNPKDICVSYYNHILGMKKMLDTTGPYTFSKHLRNFISKFAIPCSYMWYIKEFEQFQKQNPDYPILNVFYEDMKKQPENEIKRLAKFMGKDVSDKLVCEIAEKCHFDNLKKANDDLKEDHAKRFSADGKPMMYRKGQVGDWKNQFTVAENEIFDQWIEEQSKDTDITFTYE